jgi:hypothetical protein
MMPQERGWVGWYYQLGERQVGPVPKSRIAQLVAAGQLQPSQKVWRAWNEGVEFHLDQTEARQAMSGDVGSPPGCTGARFRAAFMARCEIPEAVN